MNPIARNHRSSEAIEAFVQFHSKSRRMASIGGMKGAASFCSGFGSGGAEELISRPRLESSADYIGGGKVGPPNRRLPPLRRGGGAPRHRLWSRAHAHSAH